ncbi:MAG: lectin-like protein [Polyangiales bacterium]
MRFSLLIFSGLVACSVDHTGLQRETEPDAAVLDSAVLDSALCADGESRDCDGTPPLGVCRMGTQFCVSGRWSPCEAPSPAEEVCDAAGLDEDCDGQNNEGCACDPGDTFPCGPSSETGVCVFGVATCRDGTMSECVGAVLPSDDVCDGNDNDCDGETDEDPSFYSTFYADGDEDTFGDPESSVDACSAPDNHVSRAGDCDDTTGTTNEEAAESCNGVNDDCDAAIDEGVTTTFFLDSDNDGFGDVESPISACEEPEGYVENSDDCDDSSGLSNPDADERCDARDNDCDGERDENDNLCLARCTSSTFNGRVYLHCEEALDRGEAVESCASFGAGAYRLVVIETEEENSFLFDNGDGRPYYIGLGDSETEGSYVWIDGTPESSPLWSSGEPNNFANEDCVAMGRTGSWFDLDCDRTEDYICESVLVLPE